MPFDVTKRTPLSRTMAPLASEYEEPLEVDLDRESLQHYGVQGMRWGVRKSSYSRGGKTFRRTIRKVKKATSNYIGKQNAKKKLQEDKKKAIEASKKRKKSPKDMDPDELKDYYNRTVSQRKLQAAASNKVLDMESRGRAKRMLREMDSMSTEQLKKESDKVAERARQLNELRPSYGKKPGRAYKFAGTIIKNALNNEALVDKALDKTIGKTMGTTKLTSSHKDMVKNVTKNMVKNEKDKLVDKAIDKVWKTRVDKRGGF